MAKALILAAGQGTRLRPITNDIPKCLVPLMGETLLERQVATLHSQDVTDIHIVTGYRADQIEVLGFDTSHNKDYEKTNMVESLFSALEFMESCDEDLIIAYGDIIYKKENLQKLLSCCGEIAIMIDKEWLSLWSLREENPLDDAETLVLNSEEYITELGKKPENYEKFKAKFEEVVKETLPEELRTPEISINSEIELGDITPKFFRILNQFAPFGPQNMRPTFMANGLRDNGYGKQVGADKSHLKLNIISGADKKTYNAIGFGLGDKYDLATNGTSFSAVFNIDENHWNGNTSLQLLLEDIQTE